MRRDGCRPDMLHAAPQSRPLNQRSLLKLDDEARPTKEKRSIKVGKLSEVRQRHEIILGMV